MAASCRRLSDVYATVLLHLQSAADPSDLIRRRCAAALAHQRRNRARINPLLHNKY